MTQQKKKVVDDFRLIVVGNRQHSKYILRSILENEWSVSAAVTATGSATTEQVGYDSMQNLCQEFDIPLLEVENINEEHVYETLEAKHPTLGICCGWTDIISKRILDLPDRGFVGLHASPLPKGRGGAPVNWQLIHGCDRLTVSLFQFTPEVDHGDIVAQRELPIEERDDIATAYRRFTQASIEMLAESLPKIAQETATWKPQSFAEATYWPARKPMDGLIDWSRDPEPQWNWIRALTDPYPGAFTFYNGKKLIVWRSKLKDQNTSREDGEVIEIIEGEGINVQTGDGVLQLTRVQTDGNPPRWADEYATANDLNPGDRIGKPTDFPDWLYTGLRDEQGGLNYQTNVSNEEDTCFQAVCCSHARPREIKISAFLNNDLIVERSITADGWRAMEIPISIQTPGSHTLKVIFEEEGEIQDKRFIKVYSGEDSK